MYLDGGKKETQICALVTVLKVHLYAARWQAMERMGVACSLHERPEPTRLCKHHYRIIHIILQPPQTNISLRHCNSMPCPQPEVIQQHLRENTDFEGHVEAQDKVCLPAINVIS